MSSDNSTPRQGSSFQNGNVDEIGPTPPPSFSSGHVLRSSQNGTPITDPHRQQHQHRAPRRELGPNNFLWLQNTSQGSRGVMSSYTDDDSSTTNLAVDTLIRGTDINVERCNDKVVSFVKNFKLQPRSNASLGNEALETRGHDDVLDEDSDVPYYVRRLKKTLDFDLRSFDIDMAHVKSYDQQLYHWIINYPTEVIEVFDGISILRIFEQFSDHLNINNDPEKTYNVAMRPYNLDENDKRHMREINPTDISRLVSIRGMVTRCSQVLPEILSAYYRCSSCFQEQIVQVSHGRIVEPKSCPNCHAKNSFVLFHTRCTYSDKQVIRIQEAPETTPECETPVTASVIAWDDLVDSVKPGDRVEVTGIVRASHVRVNRRSRTVRSIFRTFLDLLHVRKINVHETTITTLVDDRVQEQKALAIAQTPNLYNVLAESVAPSIWGMQDVKKGILLQLLGGSQKEINLSGSQRFRSEINVLLIGDPSQSKSQILHYAHRIAPRGIMTSGRGSSAVGLTAYVTKDPETREMVLESGALVLSDKGVCCIDEFDKMSEFTRSILHEVMEQQTVSIAKAGIIASLNARTAVLAAANPVESKYNKSLSVIENLQLPPTLISRFDLIYLILDDPSIEWDSRLARHVLSFFDKNRRTQENRTVNVIDAENLRLYISYARNNINPRITEEATEALVSGYLTMRHAGGINGGAVYNDKTISATPRQLESLIRLSEAHARMRLSHEVSADDVYEAIRLVEVATQRAAVDPETGRIDQDQFARGRTTAGQRRIENIAEAVWTAVREIGGGDIASGIILQNTRNHSDAPISDEDYRKALHHLRDEGKVILIRNESVIRVLSGE